MPFISTVLPKGTQTSVELEANWRTQACELLLDAVYLNDVFNTGIGKQTIATTSSSSTWRQMVWWKEKARCFAIDWCEVWVLLVQRFCHHLVRQRKQMRSKMMSSWSLLLFLWKKLRSREDDVGSDDEPPSRVLFCLMTMKLSCWMINKWKQ